MVVFEKYLSAKAVNLWVSMGGYSENAKKLWIRLFFYRLNHAKKPFFQAFFESLKNSAFLQTRFVAKARNY